MMNTTAILVRLAWRNLWRNPRRTFIMFAAITLGVWAMVFMSAMMRGMVDGMLVNGLYSLPGHIQIHHEVFRDDPNIQNNIPQPQGDLLTLLESEQVAAWSARLRVSAMITSERASRGITLLGVKPRYEPQLGFGNAELVEGRFIIDEQDKGIVIGRKLLQTLETDLGKRVVILSQDPGNNVVDRGFKIVGVFKSTVLADEEQFVFAGRNAIQTMLGVPNRVTEIAINGHDARHIDALTQEVRALVTNGAEAMPWTELNAYLRVMVEVMDGFVLVFMVIIFVALSFGLVNTLMMAIFERVREIGLMQALGMKPGNILYQVMCETLTLLVLGLIAGNIIALASIWLLRDGIDLSVISAGLEMAGMSSLLYPVFNGFDFILASLVVLVLGSIAGFLPAWRASRYRPVQALAKT